MLTIAHAVAMRVSATEAIMSCRHEKWVLLDSVGVIAGNFGRLMH